MHAMRFLCARVVLPARNSRSNVDVRSVGTHTHALSRAADCALSRAPFSTLICVCSCSLSSLLPSCDENLVESTCILCGEGSEKGILQRLKADECAQVPPVRGAQGDSRFAHTFCLKLFQLSPSKPTDCRLCGKPLARLSCELCSTSFHPPCALGHKTTLRYSASGHVLCYCDAHADAPAAAASSSSSHHPITVKREPGANGSSIAAASSPVPPASAHAAAPAKSSTAATSHVPTMKPTAKSSAPLPAKATIQTVPKPSGSAAKPAAAAAASTKLIPAAKPPIEMKSAAPNTAEKSAAATLKPAFKTPTLPIVSAAASKAKHAAAPITVATAAASSSSAMRTSISSLAPAPKPASPAKPSKPKAAAAAAASPAAPKAAASSSSSAAAASSSSAAAASSKPAAAKPAPKPTPKPSSSFTAPAAAASSAPRFTSHPDVAGHAMSDSDEGEAEFTGMSSVSTSEDQEEIRATNALKEIKESRAAEKALPDNVCRVCGEDWAQDDTDEEGNLKEGGQYNDEMVICEGCEFPYHQSCYGILHIPEDDYFCWGCKAHKKPGEIKCVICLSREWRGFCNVQYGPHSPNRHRTHFAHTACAHWMPPCEFVKPEWRNPVKNVEQIPKAMYNLKCSLCKRADGAKLQCRHKDCVRAMHPLCAIDHASAFGASPPTIFMDDRAQEDDIVDEENRLVRPPKTYYCEWHSKIPLLKRKRQELIDADEPTDEIDVDIKLAELKAGKVVLTKAMPSKHKLVSNPPMGRRKTRAIEVDPTDEEERHAKYEEDRKAALAELEIMDAVKLEKLKSEPGAGSKRKQESIIDADCVESVDSDSDGGGGDAELASLSGSSAASSEPQPKKRKRLQKVAQLSVSNGGSRAALAEEQRDLEISTKSNAQIEKRRAMRSLLERILGEAELGSSSQLSVAVEKALFLACKSTTDAKYRERGGDITTNLKNNGELRRQLQSGELSPDVLANMSSAEMATNAQKQQRQEESKQAMREATASSTVGVMKDGRLIALDPSTLKRVDTNGGTSAAAAGGSPSTPKRAKSGAK